MVGVGVKGTYHGNVRSMALDRLGYSSRLQTSVCWCNSYSHLLGVCHHDSPSYGTVLKDLESRVDDHNIFSDAWVRLRMTASVVVFSSSVDDDDDDVPWEKNRFQHRLYHHHRFYD